MYLGSYIKVVFKAKTGFTIYYRISDKTVIMIMKTFINNLILHIHVSRHYYQEPIYLSDPSTP
jgi:hypothetical protein